MKTASWHFYIPLAEVLPVPDGFTFIKQPSAPMRTASGEIMETSDGVAIQFHHIEGEPEPRTEFTALESLLAHRSTKSTRGRGLLGFDHDLTNVPTVTTIVEAVVDRSFRSERIGVDVDQDLSDAFDFAISRVNEVLKAISMILHTPYSLVRRESLPAALPFGEGLLRPRDLETSKMQRVRLLGAFHVNDNFPEQQDPEQNRDELKRWLDVALPSASIPGPWQTAKGLFHEAERHRLKLGDYSLATVLYATACETFLDEFVQHTLWERNRAPHEALPHFMKKRRPNEPKGIISFVAGEVHTLFSDKDWPDGAAGELYSWKTDVVDLRNRVIHSGYTPTSQETDRAANSTRMLFEYIGDELFIVRRRFPVTSLALLGEGGLDRRGSYRELVSLEPNIDSVIRRIETFRRWSNQLQQLRENPKLLGSEIAEKEAYACLVRTRRDGDVAYAVNSGKTVAKRLPPNVLTESDVFVGLINMMDAEPLFFGKEPVVFAEEPGGFEVPANEVWDLYGYEALPGEPLMYEDIARVGD